MKIRSSTEGTHKVCGSWLPLVIRPSDHDTSLAFDPRYLGLSWNWRKRNDSWPMFDKIIIILNSISLGSDASHYVCRSLLDIWEDKQVDILDNSQAVLHEAYRAR